MDKPVALSQEEIDKQLKEFAGWEPREKYLEKKFHFRLFKEALDFVNKVGEVAETANHHPDILLYNYNRVKVSTTTHAVGGKITNLDFNLIDNIERITRKEIEKKQ